MHETLLALIVIIPMMVALFLVFSNNKIYKLVLLLTAQSFGIISAVILLSHTVDGTAIFNTMGGWEAAYGIQITADKYTALMLLLINVISLTATLHSFQKERKNFFYSILILCHTGLSGMIISNDLFNIYVFLELSSLATYALIATKHTHSSYKAAFEYLVIGTIAATFYLIGVGLLYATTGNLNITAIAAAPELLFSSRIGRAGILLTILGLSAKCAIFPLHFWLVRCYSATSTTVATFLSGTSSKVGLYLLAKFIYTIFGERVFIFPVVGLDKIILISSALAIIFCGIQAILSKEIKQALSYSSVSQIGYIILTLSLDSVYSIPIAMLQMFAHAFAKSALFILSGGVQSEKNKKHSFVQDCYLLISTLSLAGIPITAGFLGKVQLLMLVIQTGHYVTLATLIIGSIIALMYSWRIFTLLRQQLGGNSSIFYHAPLSALSLLNIVTIFAGTHFLNLL
ncbi:NADH-Ubiquinone/plastoquinone (complex I), various chains family protein [Neorickettsia helminthoeca str. Oregon]|uniref:NADH-Ubiquinone/plastoquinone (Complex I), various chains family protein n=1 Tax=Neorickettsia helminthoeca str. Oregon TaxID=1286528 RepID=X5H4J2_9RICK|nr:proton-conducting transporter membrane subunit [Neorickettsia helminthoeca]AHX11603.1 NADH-Ubiquinone/plastoquinone (complex I), various chains family protein [Neorickettsia helminthoeca str. Oregon]